MDHVSERLRGQVAVVTGGAAGIGRAISTRLAAEGASVVIADRDAAQAEATAAALGGLAAPTDVTSSASVNAMRDQVLAAYGRADIVVNNAGIHIQKLAVDLADEEWDAIQQTNARGCFFTCRAFAPTLMRQGSGRVINIVTRLGAGNPYSSAYVASKAAIQAFTQCLAMELAPYGVTANCVAPGHIGPGTGMERWFRAKADLLGLTWEQFEAQVLRSIPLGRWCTPEEVAGAVAFLASAEARYMTAETMQITGGWGGYGSTPPKEDRWS
jgi:NAD(P)-dependent dehydrogenase (short-subunit alcohol dehydrogenase family)